MKRLCVNVIIVITTRAIQDSCALFSTFIFEQRIKVRDSPGVQLSHTLCMSASYYLHQIRRFKHASSSSAMIYGWIQGCHHRHSAAVSGRRQRRWCGSRSVGNTRSVRVQQLEDVASLCRGIYHKNILKTKEGDECSALWLDCKLKYLVSGIYDTSYSCNFQHLNSAFPAWLTQPLHFSLRWTYFTPKIYQREVNDGRWRREKKKSHNSNHPTTSSRSKRKPSVPMSFQHQIHRSFPPCSFRCN